MLVLVCTYSPPMDLFLFCIPFKGKERPAKTKLMPAKLRAVLPAQIRLHAVLATFGFSEMSFTGSTQC